LLQVLQLYCVTPFGRIHGQNPDIRQLASFLGRTPSAVALKMSNFASLDPSINRKGMSNFSKLDKVVWEEFFSNLEVATGEDDLVPGENAFTEQHSDFVHDFPLGIDVDGLSKSRVNQDFFRKLILASYDNRCALTGIDTPELLVASHIVPWSVDATARTNPSNGICLNALHDCAFDGGYLTFDEDLSVVYSSTLSEDTRNALASLGQKKLRLPSRFVPDKRFLDYHRQFVFVR
jgi:putative restriction endonuclease